MDAEFWNDKWKKHDIGFHLSDVNSNLVKHFHTLSLSKNSRIFIPLCGKTQDIAWLLSKGMRVVGAELSETAIQELFGALKLVPEIKRVGKLKHFQAKNIDIFVGDIFELSQQLLGDVDATYDRAALVALPIEMRKKYSTLLKEITLSASQLLISFEYDQTLRKGPPFSVNSNEINSYYQNFYAITLLESINMKGWLNIDGDVSENIWVLKKV
jgi:thiopurine S-methyltransferase